MLALRATTAVLCLAVAGTVGGARAQRSGAGTAVDPDAVSHARALFLEGAAQARSGNWTEALDRFMRSYALRPHAVTEYNVGYCERALGHYTRARKALLQALHDHEARGAVEMPPAMVDVAHGYVNELEPQIARVTVTLAPSTAALAVDARPLEPAVAGAQPVMLAGTRDPGPGEAPPDAAFELQIDPGTHVFVVSLAGHRDTIVTREIAAGGANELRLSLADADQAATATIALAAPVAAAPVQLAAHDLSRHSESGTKPALAYVAMITGGAGLLAGAVTGTIAWAQASELEDQCPDKQCVGREGKALDRANAIADAASAALIAGGVVFAGGAVLWMFAGDAEPKAHATGAHVKPWVGLAAAGCTGSF